MPNVLITGVSQGIGLALCEAYLERGYHVFGTIRDVKAPIAALEKRYPEHLSLFIIDLVRMVQNEEPFNFQVPQPLDIFIHNAGLFKPNPLIHQMTHSYQLHCVAPLAILEACPKVHKCILMSSEMASIERNQTGGWYGYRSSKAGVNAIVKSLSRDAPNMISIALHPGRVKTASSRGGKMEPAEAAPLILDFIDQLEPAHSGGFWSFNGTRLPY